MNESTIIDALKRGERVTLECKKASGEVPKSLWETYSAFANTIGGLILLGVDEDKKEKNPEKRYRVIGVDDPQKIITDFWNTINSDKVNANILSDSNVEVVNMDGKQLVCIHVPMADWRSKPIYLNGNVYKGTFRRNHEGDYHCTERQVKAMIRDSFEDGNDSLLIEHYGMDDIDLDSLHRYRTLFQYRNEGHVWNEIDDKSFLKNLGGYVVVRESGKECLTMAGLLMFGKGLSIRERFDNFRMDYIDFCNLIGEERYSDRLTYDGRWENNLYQFFSRVIPKVTFDLPRPFRMEGIQRVDDTPQHKAVREAFTNAIIHSDFIMESGILRIEKHDDKLVFRNPGLLRLPIEQIYEGGVSFARNPKIQNMLRMVGYGENLGSGFPLILDAWKQAGWEKPELKNRIDVDEVELVLPLPSTKAVTTANELPKGLTDGLPKGLSKRLSDELSKGLSETAVKILKLIYLDNYISRETLAEKTGISVTSVQNHVNKLKSMGILKRIGSAKSGHWEVVK